MPGGDYKVQAGKTLLETMWEELDGCVDDLMSYGSSSVNEPDYREEKGRAAGVAWCIALLTHAPNDPDVDAIRAKAMERRESRQ